MRFGGTRGFGDTVADIAHRIETRHVLLMQKIDGMRFALGEDSDEHIGAGHFLAARHLHMVHRTLDDTLEARRRFSIGHRLVDHQAAQFLIEKGLEGVMQLIHVDIAGPQHSYGILVLGQGQQQMLQRGKLVLSAIGIGQGSVQGLFKHLRQHPCPFPGA